MRLSFSLVMRDRDVEHVWRAHSVARVILEVDVYSCTQAENGREVVRFMTLLTRLAFRRWDPDSITAVWYMFSDLLEYQSGELEWGYCELLICLISTLAVPSVTPVRSLNHTHNLQVTQTRSCQKFHSREARRYSRCHIQSLHTYIGSPQLLHLHH